MGAMSAQNAMNYFKPGVLVITPGDREDIVLAAGTASMPEQRKDGGHCSDRRLRPSASVLKVIRTMPIPVLLAKADSYRSRFQSPQPHRQNPPGGRGKNLRSSATSSPSMLT